jgi:hypothetical protein
MNFRGLTQVHRDRRRWVNLPFVLLLASSIFWGVVGGEPLGELLPFFILLPLFLIQLLWPTIAGWAATIVTWSVPCILIIFEARSECGCTVCGWALSAFLLAYLIPLFIYRPHRRRHSC